MSLRRIRKGLFLMIIISLTSGLLGALDTGDSISSFSVVSGDGKILIQSDLSGRNTFLFYEDRSKLDTNQNLKSFLQQMNYRDNIARIIVVADCSNAGLFKRMWQKQLTDSSRKSGLTIFGDWNGSLNKALTVSPDTSSFYFIDPEGVVQYFREGSVPEEEFQRIHSFVNP